MSKHFYLPLLALAWALLGTGCAKYKDPPKASPDDRLTNHYCNDPRAVNYNWGFPGIADNGVCVFPVDSFVGRWRVLDSVFLPNGDLYQVSERDLSIEGLGDSLLAQMRLSGWCDRSGLYFTATKYSRAYADTLIEGSGGQLACNTTDTLMGLMRLSDDTLIYPKGTLLLEFEVHGGDGRILQHKGTGSRP